MSNINDVPMVMVLLSYGMGLGIRTDSHVTTKIFEIDGLPNFLRYGAPLVRLWHSGAPLLVALLKLSNLIYQACRENPFFWF